jgi:formylglycine-generating enzyme
MLLSIIATIAQAETRIFINTPTFEGLEEREEEELYLSFQNAVIDVFSGYMSKESPITIISFRDTSHETDVGASYFINIEGSKTNNNIHAYFVLQDNLNNVLLEREFHSNKIFMKDESSRVGWLMMNEYFGADNNADKYKIYENYMYTAYIDSIPSNALVYKSESEICTTPCSFQDSLQRFTVKLTANGYKPIIHTVDFSSGENVQRDTIILTPENGQSYIQSVPSGAKVFIQGEEKGNTPLFLPLEPKTYTVRLEEECSSPKQIQLEINPDSYKKNIVDLSPQLVENPLADIDTHFYTEEWNEDGDLVITFHEKGSSIPKCTDALIYKDQNDLLHFVPMNKDGVRSTDTNIPNTDQLRKSNLQTGQWVEPFRLPDPRALFRLIGIKKFYGENRGDSTPMVLISGGKHKIPYGDYSNSTQLSTEISLEHDFYMFQKEVGQYLYSEVMSQDIAYFQKCGSNCPVEQVSWISAITFANRLSEKMGLEPCYEINNGIATWNSGYECEGFRLPTEDEWRVAAKVSLYSKNTLYEQAWLGNNSFARTHTSCSAAPNDAGICDIFGNVAEWVWDSTQAKTEEEKAIIGGDRYLCGGHALSHEISSPAKYCIAERPSTENMNTGFRLVRTITPKESSGENPSTTK